jgi:2-keto-4-pentenoate hydratase/2-oxohepta-3-ene-1,7-dioic acid hydratase in catechol pathway
MRGQNGTYQGELGGVIGSTCMHATASEALDYIAGYTVVNDFTANDCIKEDTQLLRGKSHDGFLPMGPVFVTRDEIGDPHNLTIRTEVDGELRQDGNTKNMIINTFALIEYFSGFLTLVPGDVIATGTPAGTGPQFSPPRFVKPGQTVRVTVQGIGTLESVIG